MNLTALKDHFDPKLVSWRVGATNADKSKGLALAYIDARDVQDRLDEVCGPENWQNRYSLQDKTTICEIGIKIGDEWIWKSDGAGATDVEAEKGQLSDAFKRCAVKWGVGRYLYDVSSPWVELEAAGRSFKIKPSEMPKLWAALGSKSTSQAPSSERAPEGAPKNQSVPGVSKTTAAPKMSPVDWAKKMIITVQAMRDPKVFDAWYTMEIRDAIKRLGTVDAKVQDDLVKAVSDALDRFNPIGA